MTMVLCLLLSVMAGGTAFAADANADTDESNPLLNFAGLYTSEEGLLTVEAGEGYTAILEIYCEKSEQEVEQYTITGVFDPDTLRVSYADGIKEVLTPDENGAPISAVEYTDGAGYIQFYDDGTVAWQNETEGTERTFAWFDFIDVIDDITSQEFFSQDADLDGERMQALLF